MASSVSRTTANSVFQFKISLKYPKPPIWRRVLVPGDYTFKDLHFAIQSVMSWSNSHMHKFDLKDPLTGEEIEVGGCGDLGFNKWVPESTKLHTYFKNGNGKATYDYDFGATWYHNILLEKILPADRTIKYPLCIAGRRASPPEHGFPDEFEEEYDPELFDAKLITFPKCRDFLKVVEAVQSKVVEAVQSKVVEAVQSKVVEAVQSKVVEAVQSKDLSSDENASDSSEYPSFHSSIGYASSEIESDLEQAALGPEFTTSTTQKVEQTIDKQQQVIDYLSSQNSKEKASSILPQKRKVPEDEPKSMPVKLIVLENKDLKIKSSTLLETTKITKMSESEQSNSMSRAEDVTVSSVTEDAEDYYGKFIASQMRDIKDLEKREDLRIEIQQLISKYRFKN